MGAIGDEIGVGWRRLIAVILQPEVGNCVRQPRHGQDKRICAPQRDIGTEVQNNQH